MPVKIDVDTCIGCGMCEQMCPEKALTVVDGKSTLTGKCTSKGTCVENCPVGALSL